MNILQINKYFYPKGGSESVFFNTIELLKKHGQAVHCLAVKDPKNRISDDSDYFIDYPEMSEVGIWSKIKNSLAFFYNRDAKKKMEQFILDHRPDIAHIHLLFNGLSVSILPVLKKHKIPVVMTAHDYRLICPAYLFLDGDGHVCERCRDGNYLHCIRQNCSKKNRLISAMLCLDMYFRNLFYPITNYVDKFIFVSDFTFEKHSSYNSNYKEKGVRLYNFVESEAQHPAEKKKSAERYYLYYGRLSREKGISMLIEAVRDLDVKLKIVGRGPLPDECVAQAPQNVEIVGFKRGKELQDLIKNAYFVIIPSEWYETFGLTVVEPQSLGVPVIGAKIGAIPELIINDENGYLFEAGNVVHLKQTIEKAEQLPIETYQTMSLKAAAFAGRFADSEAYYSTLMTIYEETQNYYMS